MDSTTTDTTGTTTHTDCDNREERVLRLTNKTVGHRDNCDCDACLKANDMFFVPDKPEDERKPVRVPISSEPRTIWDALAEEEITTMSQQPAVRDDGIEGTLYWQPGLTDEQIEAVLMEYYGGEPQMTLAEVRAEERKHE